MVAVPPNPVTAEDLAAWWKMTQDLTALKASEMLLRTKIFKGMFPTPKEGTNKVPLTDGWELQAVHAVNRKVDPAAAKALQEEFIANGINPAALIELKPELKKAAYNELTQEQKNLFDNALIVSDGSPQMKIVLPAKNRPKEA